MELVNLLNGIDYFTKINLICYYLINFNLILVVEI